jgi:predicted negative regulator of RcsB-dependent stress response
MTRTPFTGLALLAAALLSGPSGADELSDLFFAEARYYALQGDYFGALERLDSEVAQHEGVDEPELDTLYPFIHDAEFSLGDFELRYRMHHRAGRAITAVLEGAVDEIVRNDAAYRLARIHFQKGQADDALRALERIDGKVPESIRDDIEFLRANIHLARKEAGLAVDVLKRLQGSDDYDGFAAYNLGIALLEDGQAGAGMEQLERAGQLASDDPSVLAIRDKANLVLATLLLEQEQHERARPVLNRVRMDGPFSNQALLNAGWSSLTTEDYERAVVPWSILAEREVTDRATQEAMLALPYAYGKLNVHGRAAVHYGYALDAFGAEIDKLNSSIESIRDGRFLEALIREEIREDKDWVIRLRSLPDAPETYYLMDLLATHDFQTGLQNYLDLAELRRKLVVWQSDFDAYGDMVGIRYNHYEPLLPEIDQEFRKLDSRLRLRKEQHRLLKKRLDDMLTTPRPRFLASNEENAVLGRIEALEAELEGVEQPFRDDYEARLRRLKGLLMYTLDTEYHERLTRFDANLRTLNEAMTVAQTQYDQFVRGRQAATHSYVGYEDPFKQLRQRVATSIERVDLLMQRQGRLLEIVAIDELIARRGRLEDYRDKARYALADSYDRATQTQASRGSEQ